MKKYIPLIISIILLTAISCRQVDSLEENEPKKHVLSRNRTEINCKSDTTQQQKDPPIKDGQDWRLYQ
ncbi:hypothetical protein [Chryseobacterium sp. OSA05B]|uniref:hypothetical protein n=1 Tax=Chryseobacterium sp. OSA05B TaxID=2862650 RepID=UPI001CBD3FBD|nr:hypothetical protein [Chryseobacterium sp. OSA05B]